MRCGAILFIFIYSREFALHRGVLSTLSFFFIVFYMYCCCRRGSDGVGGGAEDKEATLLKLDT